MRRHSVIQSTTPLGSVFLLIMKGFKLEIELEDQHKQSHNHNCRNADHRQQTAAAASAPRRWRPVSPTTEATAHRGSGSAETTGATSARTSSETAGTSRAASSTGAAVMSTRTWHMSFLHSFFFY